MLIKFTLLWTHKTYKYDYITNYCTYDTHKTLNLFSSKQCIQHKSF